MAKRYKKRKTHLHSRKRRRKKGSIGCVFRENDRHFLHFRPRFIEIRRMVDDAWTSGSSSDLQYIAAFDSWIFVHEGHIMSVRSLANIVCNARSRDCLVIYLQKASGVRRLANSLLFLYYVRVFGSPRRVPASL